jgi:hypothetical protein
MAVRAWMDLKGKKPKNPKFCVPSMAGYVVKAISYLHVMDCKLRGNHLSFPGTCRKQVLRDDGLLI